MTWEGFLEEEVSNQNLRDADTFAMQKRGVQAERSAQRQEERAASSFGDLKIRKSGCTAECRRGEGPMEREYCPHRTLESLAK